MGQATGMVVSWRRSDYAEGEPKDRSSSPTPAVAAGTYRKHVPR